MSVLQGIRVVEVASMVLVPSAATVLADFGADVVKVESPDGGDQNRYLHELPTLPASSIPYSFVMDNRTKRGIALDLKQPDGLAILHRLLSTADVFLTNFRAAALGRLQLTYEDLAPRYPRLVYASASGFGDHGPEAHRPAYDTVVYWTRSGLETSVLTPEGTLGQLPIGSGDHPSGMVLFGAVMLALFARERTGRGQNVSTSLLASGAWANASTIQAQLCGATMPPKYSRRDAPSFGGVYYRTGDGRALKFALVNPGKLWPLFCRAVERPDFIEDPRFATMAARKIHAQSLIGLLDDVFARHDAAHWQGRLEAHDIPFAVLPSYADVAADPQMRAAGIFVPFEDDRFGPLETVDSPIRLAGATKTSPRTAPELGEHTVEVLEGLDYSKEEIDGFIARGVAAQAVVPAARG